MRRLGVATELARRRPRRARAAWSAAARARASAWRRRVRTAAARARAGCARPGSRAACSNAPLSTSWRYSSSGSAGFARLAPSPLPGPERRPATAARRASAAATNGSSPRTWRASAAVARSRKTPSSKRRLSPASRGTARHTSLRPARGRVLSDVARLAARAACRTLPPWIGCSARSPRFLREHGVQPRRARARRGLGRRATRSRCCTRCSASVSASRSAHVHHGLRGAEADADLAFVATLSHALGVPFVVHARRRRRRATAARPRRARARCATQALERAARAARLRAHRDRAPPRRPGRDGAAARGARHRPRRARGDPRRASTAGGCCDRCSDCRRAELRRYLAERGLAFREDASNARRSASRATACAPRCCPRSSRSIRARARAWPRSRSCAAQADAALVGELEPRARRRARVRRRRAVARRPRRSRARRGAARRAPGSRSRARAGLGAELTRDARRADRARSCSRAAPGRVLSLPRGFALCRERARLWLGPAPGPRCPRRSASSCPRDGALEFPERGLRLSWHACTAPDPPARLLRLPARPREALVARSPTRRRSDLRARSRAPAQGAVRERPMGKSCAGASVGRRAGRRDRLGSGSVCVARRGRTMRARSSCAPCAFQARREVVRLQENSSAWPATLDLNLNRPRARPEVS